MPFQKGQVANPLGAGAHKRRRPITEMYIRLLASNPDKLEKFCKAQIEKACEGDTVAAKDIIDRIEGKPLQTIDVNDNRQSDAASRIRDLAASLAKGNSSGRETVQ